MGKNLGKKSRNGAMGRGRLVLKSFFAQEYFRSPIVVWLLVVGIFANIANWVILRIWVQPVDFSIILHYNVYFGVDMIGDYLQVYILPIIGLALFFINAVLSLYFYKQKERIASYILLITMLMTQLSLIVASTSIILINY